MKENRKSRKIIGIKESIVIASVLVCLLIVSCWIKPHLILLNVLSAFLIAGLCILCIYMLKKYCILNDRRFLLIIWIVTSLISLLIYCFFVFFRNMDYTDDHTVYYNSYFELERLFETSQIKGLGSIPISCWFSDYSYFITVLLSLPFSLTNQSHEMFIVCYYFLFIIPFYLSANLLAYSIFKECSLLRQKMALVFLNVCLLFFPLLHFASILGMPDIFGLFFCFTIILLLIKYNFYEFSLGFSIILSVLIVLLVITRRWYIFWLLGYIPSFFIISQLHYIINDKTNWKIVLINKTKTIIVLGAFGLLSLAPFVYNTFINRHYSTEYDAWYLGGFPFELKNQLGYLGILLAIILLVGVIYGLIEKRLRVLTISSLFGLLLTMFLFTLIQNMGKHQSLCLFPYYFIFLCNYIIMANNQKNKALRLILNSILVLVFIFNVLSTVLVWYDDLNGIFIFTKYAISSRFIWIL